MEKSPGLRLAPLSVLVAAILGGTAGTAVALVGSDAHAALIGAARLGIASLVLVTAAFATGRGRALVTLLRGTSRAPILVAGVAVAACQVAYFAAISSTGVGIGTVIAIGCTPVACGVLARWWGREPLPRDWTLAAACAIAGCALLLVPGAGVDVHPAGVALAAAAGSCYGVYTVAVRRVVVSQPDILTVAAVTLGVGGVLLSPIVVADGSALLDLRGLIISAWIGVVATGLAYLLYVRGLAGVRAATAGTLALAEPLTAAVLGVVVLGERPTPLEVTGGVLVAIGLVVAAGAYRTPRRTATTAASRVANA